MGKASRKRPKRLSEKLSAIRNGLNLTFEGLIERLDCPDIALYRASISQYENDKGEPPLEVLLQYARLANVYVDVLIDDDLNLPAYIPANGRRKLS